MSVHRNARRKDTNNSGNRQGITHKNHTDQVEGDFLSLEGTKRQSERSDSFPSQEMFKNL